MRARLIIVLHDPPGDGRLCLLIRFESVLPNALELKCPDEWFGDGPFCSGVCSKVNS